MPMSGSLRGARWWTKRNRAAARRPIPQAAINLAGRRSLAASVQGGISGLVAFQQADPERSPFGRVARYLCHRGVALVYPPLDARRELVVGAPGVVLAHRTVNQRHVFGRITVE